MSENGILDIRAARQELDAVIDEIRAVDGFEDFLAPPTFEDVARAAEPAPVVYLAAAELGGLALVVRGSDIAHLSLEELTAPPLAARVNAHSEMYAAYRANRDGHLTEFARSLDDVCAWLWQVAMGLVLDELGGARHATLVAGGLLGLLPLHAAWLPMTTRLRGAGRPRRHVGQLRPQRALARCLSPHCRERDAASAGGGGRPTAGGGLAAARRR